MKKKKYKMVEKINGYEIDLTEYLSYKKLLDLMRFWIKEHNLHVKMYKYIMLKKEFEKADNIDYELLEKYKEIMDYSQENIKIISEIIHEKLMDERYSN